MDDHQRRVADFLATHDLEAPPEYRILDLAAEVGEIAADATESTDYGGAPAAIDVAEDELGDALFALLAVCESVGVDADDALETALEKYRSRLAETGSASSGE